jgi:hypothetical protein
MNEVQTSRFSRFEPVSVFAHPFTPGIKPDTRIPNPNFPIPNPYIPNPKNPNTYSGRCFDYPNLVQEIRAFNLCTRISPLTPLFRPSPAATRGVAQPQIDSPPRATTACRCKFSPRRSMGCLSRSALHPPPRRRGEPSR